MCLIVLICYHSFILNAIFISCFSPGPSGKTQKEESMGPIDTHVHLDWLPDPAAALDRAAMAGLGQVVAVGVDLASNRRIIELAAERPDLVRPALGLHPWHVRAEDLEETLDFINRQLEAATALGEVGLDYKIKVDRDLQRRALAGTLEIAGRLGKPVLLHSRYSHERCLALLAEFGIKRAVFHWYSGPLDMLDRVLDAGFHISATPSAATSQPHRAALAHAPLERILVETDARWNTRELLPNRRTFTNPSPLWPN